MYIPTPIQRSVRMSTHLSKHTPVCNRLFHNRWSYTSKDDASGRLRQNSRPSLTLFIDICRYLETSANICTRAALIGAVGSEPATI